jgi:hypothetical protein
MLKTIATVSLAVLAASLMPSRAPANGLGSVNCIGSGPFLSCVAAWRLGAPPPPQPPTEQELAASRERERKWEARCRPRVIEDKFGVGRYVYAAPGCEFGKTTD